MAIGQITISAADWLAARVTDRLALMTASSRIEDLSQSNSGTAVAPPEDSGESGLEQRQHSLLAAQDSYRKVAARIKARLADTPPADPPTDTGGRDTAFEAMGGNAKLLATLIAADTAEPAHPPRGKTAHTGTGAPSDFAQDRTQETPDTPDARPSTQTDEQAGTARDPQETGGAWAVAEARADAVAADAAMRKGLRPALSENADIPTDHIPYVKD